MQTIVVPYINVNVPMAMVNFPLLNLAQPAPKIEVIALERRRRRRH